MKLQTKINFYKLARLFRVKRNWKLNAWFKLHSLQNEFIESLRFPHDVHLDDAERVVIDIRAQCHKFGGFEI